MALFAQRVPEDVLSAVTVRLLWGNLAKERWHSSLEQGAALFRVGTSPSLEADRFPVTAGKAREPDVSTASWSL